MDSGCYWEGDSHMYIHNVSRQIDKQKNRQVCKRYGAKSITNENKNERYDANG